MYIWQNNLEWSADKTQYLSAMNCDKLYVKYVEYSNGEVINTKLNNLSFHNVVPVIRIDAPFLNNEMSNAERIATIYSKISAMHEAQFHKKLEAVQLDFDYTEKDKLRYQQLIDGLKNIYHLQVEITLNLYHVKEAASKIPKADKYIIMLYDLNNPTNGAHYSEKEMETHKNDLAIFSSEHSYALPIFNRTSVFYDNDFSYNYQIQRADVANKASFVYEGHNVYIAIEDYKLGSTLLKKNTLLEFQEASMEDLQRYRQFIGNLNNSKGKEIIYFSLNETAMKNFPAAKINALK